MGLRSLMKQNLKIIITVVVTIIAILGRKYISYFSLIQETNTINKPVQIFSHDQLKNYNGVENDILYLALLGTIFDVSKSPNHYGKGAPYHYFVGKDGSRGFVTGAFSDETDQKDHILDLPCTDLLNILDWVKTFKEKYPSVGLLAGRYYDKYGRETEYKRLLKGRIKDCKFEKEKAEKEKSLYPPCNISWSNDEGTRVWCTNSSGGVLRNWVGVPRLLYTPGEESPQCVCVQLERAKSSRLKKYEDCPDTSGECWIQTQEDST